MPVPEAVRRLHEALARRVRRRTADLDAIAREMYAAVADLPPGQAKEALRLASVGYVDTVVESMRQGLQEAARLGAAASRASLATTLGVPGSAIAPATGWGRAADWVAERGPDGLSLSSRIHRQTALYRAELDRVLERSLREGTSAQEMVRRLVDESRLTNTPITPRAIRDLESTVARMGTGGGDRAWGAASRAAAEVRSQIERLVELPRARHGIAPATEHMVEKVTKAIWDGRQDVAERALQWWGRDKQRYQFETVARTEMQRAYSTAFSEHAREVAGVEGLIWNTARDDSVCPICSALRGRVFSLEDLEEMPAHPRCRCYWTHKINRAALPREIVARALAA